MTIVGYDAFDDPYCYKGTNTLKNKLGLRDRALLESFELEMTTLRASEPLPDGRCDARHYRRVHHHLFQDVYRWAGRYRTVRTSKGGSLFCFPEHIAANMDRLFAALTDSGVLITQDVDQFVDEIAKFLADLNAIHAFREGNGRTQLAFIALLGARSGVPLDFVRVKRDPFLSAMIASYEGQVDQLKRELYKLVS